MLAQGYGLMALHPFGLSYYNLLVGGLPGATRLGLEPTYWGDTVDPVLLDALARRARPGQVVALAPTLHHLQATAATTATLADRDIVLRDETAAARADWVVVYRRQAYWRPEIRALVWQGRPVAVRSRSDVWLAGVWPGPARKIGGRKLQSVGDPLQFFQNQLNNTGSLTWANSSPTSTRAGPAGWWTSRPSR